MDVDGFWRFLDRSATETTGRHERLGWLEYRLNRLALDHIVDFQIHLDTARIPIDTHAMWRAADQIMDGLCSGDGFRYFQPWLIGQGQHWYQHASRDPDNLVDIPAVAALAGGRKWSNDEWPGWEELDYVAFRAYDRVTGQEDGLDAALDRRGHRGPSGPRSTDPSWDSDNPAEITRRLPRLSVMFPRRAGLVA
jgi:Protein of unknown function (DUF4240)